MSCDSLEEKLNDKLTPETFFKTKKDFDAGMITVNNQLVGFIGWHNWIVENYSDEFTIFTHPSGFNNDRHRRTDTHQLLPTDLSGQFPMGDFWGRIFSSIANVNSMITAFEGADDSSTFKANYIAQARTVRAYIYLKGMELYGDMPIVTTAAPVPGEPLPSRKPMKEVFNFIEKELLESIPNLPSGRQQKLTDISKESARAILSKLYLNAEVFIGVPKYQECLVQSEAILTAPGWGMAVNYFDMFKVKNATLTPQEFLVFSQPIPGVTKELGVIHNRTHTQEFLKDRTGLASAPHVGWNGPAVTPLFYGMYDPADIRKTQGFIEGPVISLASGKVLKDNNGVEINHTVEFYLSPATIPADRKPFVNNLYNGVRSTKWEIDAKAIADVAGNGFAHIRYSDIMLQKAECLIRLNGPNGVSDGLVNKIRARVFEPDKPLTNVTLNQIYWERGFELWGESHRKNDQARFNTLHLADSFHPEMPLYTNLLPIPQDQIDANPNFKQNPGYVK
ncbi:MAG: RagB/SusD family nutrient uptake outer membrane protein [Crocinitomicaceae bacterium]|nr:RagB/SusD family nutrient uptake outer membrane protein [Crocinitomicaceae bacterium]